MRKEGEEGAERKVRREGREKGKREGVTSLVNVPMFPTDGTFCFCRSPAGIMVHPSYLLVGHTAAAFDADSKNWRCPS